MMIRAHSYKFFALLLALLLAALPGLAEDYPQETLKRIIPLLEAQGYRSVEYVGEQCFRAWVDSEEGRLDGRILAADEDGSVLREVEFPAGWCWPALEGT